MNKLCGLLLTALILLYSCQKEVSYENGAGLSAEGSLQSDLTGDCLPKEVAGTFEAGLDIVPAANAIEVTVNVTKTGPYLIYTDTVNGYFFRAAGSFSATGMNTVTLPGSGKPLIEGIDNFRVIFDSSECIVPVTVEAPGAGGPAAFTFAGSPNACMDYTIQGDYVINVALNDINTVKIKVNVTTAGSYSLSTVASNGMTFAASGSVPAGEQFITLEGTGTPATSGSTTIPITFLTSECSFNINVLATPPPAKEYFPRNSGSNWSYETNDDVNDTLLWHSNGTGSVGPNTYNIFEVKDEVDGQFYALTAYRRANEEYFMYTDLAYWLGFDDPQEVEFRFLVGNAGIGTTWRSPTYTGARDFQPIKVRMKFTIVQKDAITNVNTSQGLFSHPNTVVVEERYELEQPDGSYIEDSFFYKYYYAENVGLVLEEKYDTANPAVPVKKRELRRWQIAP